MNTKTYAAIAATLAALGVPTMNAHADAINVTVNGNPVNFNGQQPVEQYGSVLVPLRGVFEQLGATVSYDASTRGIMAVRRGTTVELQLGSRRAEVNNVPRNLSVPAQSVNGSTLVPLRFVSEALGAYVDWQAPTQTVVIVSNGGGPNIPPSRPVAGNPRPGRNNLSYGRIVFNWDNNGIAVRDRDAIETQIRRDFNADPGSRFVVRRENSPGTLNVNVAMRRAGPNNVRAEVRLGLDRNGDGGAIVSASQSAATESRDNEINGDVVLDAFRKARNEFTTNANQFVRERR